jgi:hypothetical protein
MAGKFMTTLRGVFGAKAASGADPKEARADPEAAPGGKKYFTSKDYDFAADMARIREDMKKPGYGKEKTEYTKQEVLAHFRGLAKGFELVEKDLEMPDVLYKRDERGNTFSEKPDRDSSHLSSLVKLANALPPDPSTLVYTVGIFDSTYQTYFILVDPRRKLVVVDQLLYLGEGSWDNVAHSLSAAVDEKALADASNKKYSLIIAENGSARTL